MHLDWLSNQILYFSYPEYSFNMFVFNMIYFSRVLADVTHALILAVLKNYYIFFFFNSYLKLI